MKVDYLTRTSGGSNSLADPVSEFDGLGGVRTVDHTDCPTAEWNSIADPLHEEVGKYRCSGRRMVVGHQPILPVDWLVSLHQQ